jgi:hypothetical protein
MRTPTTSEKETSAALPGFSLIHSRAFRIPAVAAVEARVTFALVS